MTFPEMSVVTLNNKNKLVDTIERTIPDLYAFMVIDKGGNLLSYLISEQCAGECGLSHLKEIGKLMSIRYDIGGFSKLLGGLDVTINVFKERTVMVRKIFQDNILAIVMPRNTHNLEDRLNAVLDIIESATNIEGLKTKSDTEIVKVSSETTDFQKTNDRIQPKIYTIVSSPVNSGSFYPASKAYLNLKLGKNYRNINFDTAKND